MVIGVLYARAPADILLLESLALFSMRLLISISLILALRPNLKSRLACLITDHTYSISHRLSLFIAQFKMWSICVLYSTLSMACCSNARCHNGKR